MSKLLVNAVFQHGPQDPRQRLVLLALARCARSDGTVYATSAQLLKFSCAENHQALTETLYFLHSAGWYNILPQSTERARYLLSRHRLQLPPYTPVSHDRQCRACGKPFDFQEQQ